MFEVMPVLVVVAVKRVQEIKIRWVMFPGSSLPHPVATDGNVLCTSFVFLPDRE